MQGATPPSHLRLVPQVTLVALDDAHSAVRGEDWTKVRSPICLCSHPCIGTFRQWTRAIMTQEGNKDSPGRFQT